MTFLLPPWEVISMGWLCKEGRGSYWWRRETSGRPLTQNHYKNLVYFLMSNQKHSTSKADMVCPKKHWDVRWTKVVKLWILAFYCGKQCYITSTTTWCYQKQQCSLRHGYKHEDVLEIIQDNIHSHISIFGQFQLKVSNKKLVRSRMKWLFEVKKRRQVGSLEKNWHGIWCGKVIWKLLDIDMEKLTWHATSTYKVHPCHIFGCPCGHHLGHTNIFWDITFGIIIFTSLWLCLHSTCCPTCNSLHLTKQPNIQQMKEDVFCNVQTIRQKIMLSW